MNILSPHLSILSTCIIWGFLLGANQVYGVSYKSDLQTKITYDNVSENQISESKLLERYVNRYKENISERYAVLGKKDSKTISDAYTILDIMDNALDNIQRKYVDGREIDSLMKDIVTDLKFLNTRIRIYMQQEEFLYQRDIRVIQEKYSPIAKKIAKILDNLTDSITKGLIKKSSYTQREKNTVKILISLRDSSSLLKDFQSKKFTQKSEIKPYISNIVQSIKGDIIELKELSR